LMHHVDVRKVNTNSSSSFLPESSRVSGVYLRWWMNKCAPVAEERLTLQQR